MIRKAIACMAFAGLAAPALAADSLVRFEGGIGSQPFRSAGGVPALNTVNGTNPGGIPWVISMLSVDVKTDGRISAVGRGLLLGGGNNVGRNGGQSVRARLFCGGVAHDTPALVPLDADGDFRIDDVLTPPPPNPCANASVLIVSGGGNWFAAGIPKN